MCNSCGRRVGVQSSRFEVKLSVFRLQYNSVCAVHRYCDGDKDEPDQHIEDYIFDVNYEKFYDQLITVKSFDRNGLNITLCDPGNFDLSGYSLDKLFFEPPIDLKDFQFVNGRILLGSSPVRAMIRKRIKRGPWSNKKSKKLLEENSKIVENVTATIINSQNTDKSEISKIAENVTATVVSGQNVDMSEIPKVVTNVTETIVNDQNPNTHMSDLLKVVENESVTIVPEQNIETEIITDLIEILSDDSSDNVSAADLLKQNTLVHTNTLPNYFEVQKTTNFGIRDILSHQNPVTNNPSTVSVSAQNGCVNELESLTFPPQFGLFSNENEQGFNAIVSSNPTFNQVFSHIDQNISHSSISNINDQPANVFVIPNGNVSTTSSFNESVLFLPNNFNSQQNPAENIIQRNNSNQMPALQQTPFFCSFPNYPDSLEPSMISNVLPPITSINFQQNLSSVDYPNMFPQNFQ